MLIDFSRHFPTTCCFAGKTIQMATVAFKISFKIYNVDLWTEMQRRYISFDLWSVQFQKFQVAFIEIRESQDNCTESLQKSILKRTKSYQHPACVKVRFKTKTHELSNARASVVVSVKAKYKILSFPLNETKVWQTCNFLGKFLLQISIHKTRMRAVRFHYISWLNRCEEQGKRTH